ncbi:alcohol dehydrogenase/L-iditol 2-dehydrogenase/D-arabinitol dehydrogenase (NADP+) [Advenella incenata]|uniref:Alcohol dehydrogenase/L-iditol 2-dehydrogenase/D-arabinitol dehydrogenase (NADP+) n=1 Tax=Advenella incenata TaxID=267800 RepID=A0A4Q7VFT3_9BURK|nr:alcohol dehydrogenase catalytic domain-containing protein [Advenella incenata]RZT94859.1 alcohol dehydrogenase/L-iditol 2-dehydrogenase/D-arabinitol dehydrogenase (NADP+) [Advenella incenata]
MTEKTAKYIEFVAPYTFEAREIHRPAIGEDDLLLKISLCGVDGSELHMFRGELQWVNDMAPLIFGDEIVGTVEEIGDRARRQRKLEVGDRVALEAKWPCNQCSSCLRRQYYLCDVHGIISGYGATTSKSPPFLWGGYSTHAFVPKQALVYKIPDTLHDSTALIGCSVLANGIRWVEESGVGDGDHVLIVGPGPQGLACALVALSLGAKVSMVGLRDDASRLELAMKFGVHNTFYVLPDGPEGLAARVLQEAGQADVVIDLAGVQDAKLLGFAVVRKMGTFVNVALPFPSAQSMNWLDLLAREIRILSYASHPYTVEAGLAMAEKLLEKGIDIGSWITHIYPLGQAQIALEAAAYQTEERPIKVALNPQH